MNNKVIHLGQLAALVSGVTPPDNKKVLWYDETVTTGSPLRYYDLTTNSWELLVKE